MTYELNRIRSFSLVGHGGCGKTTIADTLAFVTGRTPTRGSVDDHSSVLDDTPEEHKKGGTLQASYLTVEHDGYKTHIVDTPGDGNFLHEARGALQGANGAVIVVSAVDGVEVSTEHVAAFAANQNVPRAVFINKMDRENADYESVVEELSDTLGLQPVLLQLPIGAEDGFRGVVDLVYNRAFTYGADGAVTQGEVPADMADAVEEAVEQLMEAVAMADDELVERYLDEGELTLDELRRGLEIGIQSGEMVPVLLGSAARAIGLDRLLWISRAFPDGASAPALTGHEPDDAEELVEIEGDADGPFAALCVQTTIDRFAGQVSVLKVVRGTLTAGTTLSNPRTGATEKVSGLFHLAGNEHVQVDVVRPGDVFAIAKARSVSTGDTLCDPKSPVVLPYVPPRPAMISYTIVPRSRKDVDKLKSALSNVLAEDPALREDYDEVTNQIVLAGMGAAHVGVAIDRMARKYGVQVDLGTPAIPYRESITGRADVRYRHKKQTGGAGQFGEVAIKVYPSDRGAGYVFVNSIKGGVIPNSLIPSVDKGVADQLRKGVLAGFPVLDVTVELYDGKYHPVDSKDIAFQIAGRQAIKEAVLKSRPVLLEPIYEVDVVVPGDLVGDVMGDLNSRRGRVLNMGNRGRNAVVKALVPLAEMLNYSPDLRSMTGGKGSYTMDFHGYENVPSHLQDKVVADVKRVQGDDD